MWIALLPSATVVDATPIGLRASPENGDSAADDCEVVSFMSIVKC
jgi:hypothetical protein